MMGERRDVGADVGMLGVERLEFARARVVIVAACLQVLLPAARGRSSSP